VVPTRIKLITPNYCDKAEASPGQLGFGSWSIFGMIFIDITPLWYRFKDMILKPFVK